jgi:hypothetical protein
VRGLFDPNPSLRTEADWRQLLAGLVESLSAFTGIRFEPTSWFVRNDLPGYASSCNCVDVRGSLGSALRIDACGVVCITVNFGEAVWASCNLLLFADGCRVLGVDGLDLIFLPYGEDGWTSQGWVGDEYGEWKSHTTDARWGDAEPGAAADRPRE